MMLLQNGLRYSSFGTPQRKPTTKLIISVTLFYPRETERVRRDVFGEIFKVGKGIAFEQNKKLGSLILKKTEIVEFFTKLQFHTAKVPILKMKELEES